MLLLLLLLLVEDIEFGVFETCSIGCLIFDRAARSYLSTHQKKNPIDRIATRGKRVLSLNRGILTTGAAENDDFGEVIKKRDEPALCFSRSLSLSLSLLLSPLTSVKRKEGDQCKAWLAGVMVDYWGLRKNYDYDPFPFFFSFSAGAGGRERGGKGRIRAERVVVG